MKFGSEVIRVLIFKKVSDDLLPHSTVFEILSFKLCEKGAFLEKFAFDIRKSTSCLRLILPVKLPFFIEISWVLQVLWSLEHIYGSFYVKMKSRVWRFCRKFSMNFPWNSNLASILQCKMKYFWNQNYNTFSSITFKFDGRSSSGFRIE